MKYLFYLLLSLLIITSACNDSVIVGSDLLGEESVDITLRNDLPLQSRTVLGDSTLTFRKLETDNYGASTYLFGSIEDATFGKTETKTYFSPALESDMPEFGDALIIDSVVMVLSLDSLGSYGNSDFEHELSLSLLSERMDADDREDFYSNLELTSESTPLLTEITKLNYTDSLTINYHFEDSLIQVEPQLRFQLDKQFWTDLSANDFSSTDEESFLDFVPGYELSSVDAENTMGAIDLGYSSSESPSNILIYYTRGDTSKLIYTVPLGKYRHSYVVKDYSGSTLINQIDDTTADCLYLESQGGTNVILDLSSIHEVDDLILNHATVVLTGKPFDEEASPAIEAIGAWYKDDEGEFVRADRSDRAAFLEETYPLGEQRWSYELDLTSYVSQLRERTIDKYELYLFPFSRSERMNRSVLYSSNHSEHPIQLNLILTNP